MKTRTLLSAILACFVIIGMASCSAQIRLQRQQTKAKAIPPGQMKKITGSQSAAPYAPGHQKDSKVKNQVKPAKKSKNKKK